MDMLIEAGVKIENVSGRNFTRLTNIVGKVAASEKTIVKKLLSSSNDMNFLLHALDDMNVKPSLLKELLDNPSNYSGFTSKISFNGERKTIMEILTGPADDGIRYFHKVEGNVHYFAKINSAEEGVFVTFENIVNGLTASAQNSAKVIVDYCYNKGDFLICLEELFMIDYE